MGAELAALAGGLPIIGGLIGMGASREDRQKALSDNQAALQQWLSLNVPDPSMQRIALQQYVDTGTFTPELQQAINQGPSQMEGVQSDQNDKSAQLRALDTLSQLGQNGGMTIADKANLENSINQANSAQAGRVGAINQGLEARGLGGSGLALQAQLAANQQANQSTNQAATNTAAMAQQRALQAIMGSGQLAGSMENQQFGEQAQKAQAADAIARFNASNANQVAGANVNRQNSGQLYNLQNKQNISNMNTGLNNQEEVYNKNLLQQAYQNQLGKTQGTSNAYNNMANVYRGNADQTASQWANIGSGAGQAAGAYANYSQNQDRINSRKPQNSEISDDENVFGSEYF